MRAVLAERFKLRRNARRTMDEIEAERAQVALVVPSVVVLGEDALQPLAVEIEPLVAPPVDARWEIGEAFGIDVLHVLLNAGFAVIELEPWAASA